MKISRFLRVVLTLTFAVMTLTAAAQPRTDAFTVQTVTGEVTTEAGPLAAGVHSGPATITTGPASKALLRFDDGMEASLEEKSVLRVDDFVPPSAAGGGHVSMYLQNGAVQIKTGEIVRSRPDQLVLRTPQGSVAVLEPSDFSILVGDKTIVDVDRGAVRVSNALGDRVVRAGSTLGIPAATSAQEGGAGNAPMAHRFWIGVSAGASRIDQAATAKLIDTGSVDETSTGFKIYAGYQLHRFIAAELAYVDLGKLSYDGTYSGAPVTNGKLELRGVDIAALATLPVTARVTVFAKAGVFAWSAQATDTFNGTGFSQKTTGSGPSLGLGASVAVTPAVTVRAELESYKFADTHARLISAGVSYGF